jgi:AbrB family looped-hinge helix DNA binding protein
MANKVGPKGQVVIAKELRDRLGIEPGWITLQRLVDDHVEVYFLPPEHRRSLKGSLSRYTKVRVSPGKEWERARETAWIAAAQQRIEAPEPQP